MADRGGHAALAEPARRLLRKHSGMRITSHHESRVRLPDPFVGIRVELAERRHPSEALVVEAALALPTGDLAGLGDAPLAALVLVVQRDQRIEDPPDEGRSYVLAPFADRVFLASDCPVIHGVFHARFRIAIDEVLAPTGAIGATTHHRMFVSLGPHVSNPVEAVRAH